MTNSSTDPNSDVTRRAEHLRRQMAARLVADGALVSAKWRAAFTHVPRHVFVPSFYQQTPTSQRRIDASTPDEWLQAVYDDTLLLTRSDASSSSTVPSLMATMLEALGPDDGDQVLEVGTGSGYNAALLCHRLGDSNVTTLDLDPELVDDARSRLASTGYQPAVVAHDGVEGWPTNDPYDGLIATCAVENIPAAWLAQVQPGGRIVTPIATGIAVLTVEGPDVAMGRFLPEPAYFMPLREGSAPSDISAVLQLAAESDAPAQPTAVEPDVWFDNGFRFLLTASVPGLRYLTNDPVGGAAIFSHPDGSWAKVVNSQVAQDGPRRLWDAVEHAHRLWDELGHPGRERFTLFVAGGQQEIRLTGTSLAWSLESEPGSAS